MSLKTDFKRAVVDGGDTAITIASGDTESSIFNCSGASLRSLYLPNNFTAANISFKVGKKESNLFDTVDVDGTLFSISCSPNKRLPLLPYIFDEACYVQIICDTAQANDVIIDAGMAPLYNVG